MKMNVLILLIAIAVMIAFLSLGGGPRTGDGLPDGGFWKGVTHGVIFPVSFIASWFTHVRVYQSHNEYVSYVSGFLTGVCIGFWFIRAMILRIFSLKPFLLRWFFSWVIKKPSQGIYCSVLER